MPPASLDVTGPAWGRGKSGGVTQGAPGAPSILSAGPQRPDSREHSVVGDPDPQPSPHPEILLLPGTFSPPPPPHTHPVPTKKPPASPPATSAPFHPPPLPQFLRPHPALQQLWPKPATSPSLPTQADRLPLQSQIPADPSLQPAHQSPPWAPTAHPTSSQVSLTPCMGVPHDTHPPGDTTASPEYSAPPAPLVSMLGPACPRAFAPAAVPAAQPSWALLRLHQASWSLCPHCLLPGTVHSHALYCLRAVDPPTRSGGCPVPLGLHQGDQDPSPQ